MDKRLLNVPAEKLAQDAVNDLSCHKHMETYRECLNQHMDKGNFRPCVKMLDDFRFCLIHKAATK